MKILWIVNTIFPAPSKEMGLDVPVYGGWMYGLAEQVSKSDGIELVVATIYSGNEIKKMNIEGTIYFLLPYNSKIVYDVKLESLWEQVCMEIKPDVVHIHGTEYAHGLACMRKLPNLNYVVSIQGLVGVYARYYFAGISVWEIFKNITFRDIGRIDTIFQQKRKFERRSKFENEYILRTEHVVGRTRWDYAHTKALNSNVNYHFCNESLRNGFYVAKKWSLGSCERHTIFLSQAVYPIKGLHQVLRALALLKKDFPNLKVKIGGWNIAESTTLNDKIKMSGYGKYIGNILNRYNLDGSIIFLGTLSEAQMITEYQKAHVFVCPSSIENSPNSLGEAQLIGTPIVASYVGGVPDMVKNEETGLLYRFEEFEMLAENIRCLFNNDALALRLSENGVKVASLRHDRTVNTAKLLSVYGAV